jgi:hypothetical protein
MIDDFSILLSTLLCIYVTWRAYKFNNSGEEKTVTPPSPGSTMPTSPPVNTRPPDWQAVAPPPGRPAKWDDALL